MLYAQSVLKLKNKERRPSRLKMAWIESHTVLIRHRKLIETARELRISPAYLVGHLHVLWHAALEQAEDGDLSSWSDEFIAEAACYPGDAPQFVRLLQKHRWLDGKMIHDWVDYAGLYLTKRYNVNNRERLVKIWRKYGREYGQRAGREQKESLPTLPTLPTVPTNLPNPPTEPEKEKGAENSPSPPADAVEDPNYYETPVKKPLEKPDRAAIPPERIQSIHEWYCNLTAPQPLKMNLERSWYEFLKLFTEDDFKRVFTYLRRQVNERARNEGALKLSNLLQPDKFSEDLALARTNLRKQIAAVIPKAAEDRPASTAHIPKLVEEMRKAVK